MYIVKTFSETAREALKNDHDFLIAKSINPKTGKLNVEKLYELTMTYADGEEIVNDRAIPEPCGIAFEVARKCLLVKGAFSGNITFFWYADELTHWYNRNFFGECPARASDWYQNACVAVYDAIKKGVIVTRETLRVTKNALGNTLFYCLCQETQKLSDTKSDRMFVADIYGTDDKEPSVVIPYEDRYFADEIREEMLNDKDYEADLDDVSREIIRMLADRKSQREIADALGLSKGAAYRKVKALQDKFEGLLLQYNAQ